MMIKLIEVIGSLKDGGAETLVKDYVDLIDKQKFDVQILTLFPVNNTANFHKVSEIGIQVQSVYRRYHIGVKIFHKIFGRWYVSLRMKRIVRQAAPDCIHINSPVAWLFEPIRRCLEGINLVYTCHSEPSKYFLSGHKQEESAVRALVHQNNMQLIALHDEMRLELNRRFSVSNTVVVNNGVNLRRYRRPEWNVDEIREKVGISRDAFLVIHVGRFATVKNHGFLIDVFDEIKKRKANAHLLLIGDGPLKASVCEQLQKMRLTDSVTLLSHRTDVPQLLYASDLVVFPSKYEGLSVTLVEAQATGLRCLVSDSVNKANFLTEDTIPVSLNRSAAEWAQIALDDRVKSSDYGELKKFDLEYEIRKLEQIYSN